MPYDLFSLGNFAVVTQTAANVAIGNVVGGDLTQSISQSATVTQSQGH